MKVQLYILAISFFFFSCEKKSKIEQAVEEIPVELKVERFDKAFFETNPKELPKLKTKYPFFFPAGNDDRVWLEKMQNPQWRELYSEVEKKYSNFDTQTTQIEELFKHIKYYYPKTKTPKVITIISEMDYQNKAIYADSLVIISRISKAKFRTQPNSSRHCFELCHAHHSAANRQYIYRLHDLCRKRIVSQRYVFARSYRRCEDGLYA
jgi:hypothetical protein